MWEREVFMQPTWRGRKGRQGDGRVERAGRHCCAPRLACGGVGAWVRWAWHIPGGEYVFAAMVPVGIGQGMLGGAAVVSWLEAGVGVDALMGGAIGGVDSEAGPLPLAVEYEEHTFPIDRKRESTCIPQKYCLGRTIGQFPHGDDRTQLDGDQGNLKYPFSEALP